MVHRGRGLDAAGVRLFESRVHVATAAPLAIGEQVLVRLSLGGGAPLQLEAHVVSRNAAAEVVLGFVFDGDGERARVRELMDGSPRTSMAAPPRVLVVEDSPIVSELLVFGARRDASMREAIIDVAHDGETGWKMLRRASYDAAVVDFYLPRLTGAELTRRIRGAPELARLPVVAFSMGGQAARRACLEAGVNAFLEKPVTPRALFAVLLPYLAPQSTGTQNNDVTHTR
jgi:CheY-like chemotaxis protein